MHTALVRLPFSYENRTQYSDVQFIGAGLSASYSQTFSFKWRLSQYRGEMSHSSSFLNQPASGDNIAQSANDGGSLPLVETNREGFRIDRLLTADDVAERLQ